MSKFWKNVVLAAITVVLCGGVAAGVATYVIKNIERANRSSDRHENVFKQPLQMASLNTVAAENIDFTYAAEKTVNAVVHLQVTATVSSRRYISPLDEFFGFGNRQPQRPRTQQGTGSGVIISTDGYIMTANHVIEGADSIKVILNDKREFVAKIIGGDANSDIALIKIDAENLQPLTFGDSDQLKIGEWVLAVGNPFNLTSTVTAGIVSAKGRPGSIDSENDREKIASFIQTDAAVNPGNSGGALVNTRGELVGINTAILSQTGVFAGYSFAVPISIARKVVSDLKEYGVLQRPVIGVSILDAALAKKADNKVKVLEGAYVSEFTDNSSAKEAGIEKGDVIIAVNGVKIVSAANMIEQIMKYNVGDKVRIKVDRYGSEKEFPVELRNRQGSTAITTGPKSAEILGASFRTLTDQEKRDYRVSYGIEVTGITRGGKIRESGMENGFVIMVVNNQRINTPEEFYSIVDKILQGNSDEKGCSVRGFYPRTGATRYYGINLVD